MNRCGGAAGAGVLLLTLPVAGCGATVHRQPVAARAAQAARVTTDPPDGARGVPPDRPVRVRAEGGRIRAVVVSPGLAAAPSRGVEGRLGPGGGRWQSRWPLAPGTAYRLTAWIDAGGATQTVTSAFTTQKVKATGPARVVAPARGEVVGVGMPIVIRFPGAVRAKAGVERVLRVRASRRVTGAWRWFGDDTVVFRPRRYWPPHTTVRLRAHLRGLRTSEHGYSPRDLSLRFRVGDAHITVADARTHRQSVRINGRTVRTMPISMGKATKPAYTTTSGTHLTMGKSARMVMDSTTTGCPPGCPEYYRHVVRHAVQISGSGEFVHGAPWAARSLGRVNISHGCVNLSPAGAAWFFALARRGDVVTIVHTRRRLQPANGWGYWQLGWRAWLRGSRLRTAAGSGLR